MASFEELTKELEGAGPAEDAGAGDPYAGFASERRQRRQARPKEDRLAAEAFDDGLDVDRRAFLAECTGRGEDGEPKSTIGLSLIEYAGLPGDEEESANYEEAQSRYTKRAALSIESHGEFVQADLTFKTAMEPEMRMAYGVLEEYGRRLDEAERDGGPMPLLIVNVAPDAFLTSYYLSFASPVMWTVQPEDPEDGKLNVIRMLVPYETFLINPVTDDIDIEQIEAEQQRRAGMALEERRA